MAPDENLRRRNALVIPGGILVLLSTIGILYAYGLRGDDVECGDGTRIVLLNACRSAGLALAIPLVAGLALVAFGAIRYKGHAHPHLSAGTGAHFTLAVLLGFVVAALLAWGYLAYVDDPDDPYVFSYDETDYTFARIAAGLVGLSLLMALPFLLLYTSHARAVRYHVERCGWECWDDEAEPEPTAYESAATEATVPTEPTTTETELPPLPPEPEAPRPAAVTESPAGQNIRVVSPTAATTPRPATPPLGERPEQRGPAPKKPARKAKSGTRKVKGSKKSDE